MGPPSVGNNGFSLPRDCERLAQAIADPQEAGAVTVKTDPKLVVGEYKVALGAANGNLDATRQCQARQRARVAKGTANGF